MLSLEHHNIAGMLCTGGEDTDFVVKLPCRQTQEHYRFSFPVKCTSEWFKRQADSLVIWMFSNVI